MSALEMKDTMYKLLPGVLLNLSKISATVSIAPNILEFLSTLNRLPEVYSSFVEEQYLSIFAITLPYINPFKVYRRLGLALVQLLFIFQTVNGGYY